MKQIFTSGDIKTYTTVVKPQDLAGFHGIILHEVCSTFALARDIEWTTRQFVVDMIDDDEEGIGTFLQIQHQGPAFVGEEMTFTGIFGNMTGSELVCAVEVRVGSRIVATGKTAQKILKLEKIKSIFSHG
jgi:fluoroacetyl-CoA thioesterase